MAVETIDDELVDARDAAEILRNTLLNLIRSELPKPWQQMHQHDQERVVTRVEDMCSQAVRNVCKAIASVGKNVIAANMGALSTDAKGNPTVKISFSNVDLDNEDKLAIWGHINRPVTLVLMDPSEYVNYKTKVSTMPDQREIPGTEKQGDKQPDWPKVADAIADDQDTAPESAPLQNESKPVDDFEEDPAPNRPQQSDALRMRHVRPEGDKPDAHIAEDDDDVATPDDMIEEMDDEEAAARVHVENPVKPSVPTGIMPPKARPPRQAPKK